jgi:hypothetical protein
MGAHFALYQNSYVSVYKTEFGCKLCSLVLLRLSDFHLSQWQLSLFGHATLYPAPWLTFRALDTSWRSLV